MKKVIVIGGGFAGISALKTLAKSSIDIELTLIDPKQSSDFLPSLPDIIGKKIAPDFLKIDLFEFTRKINCKFINQEVKAVDLQDKLIVLPSQKLDYDYLLLASGTQTNFFGNSKFAECALKLDNINDAEKIITALDSKSFDQLVVIGAGYTGIELATNLRLNCLKTKKEKPITIIDKSPSLLGPLPQWMKDYVSSNLTKLNIALITSAEISQLDQETLSLADGRKFEKALFIWAAGVRASEYILKLAHDKTPQGRLKVDSYLRIDQNCFAAGDIANFISNQQPLRMAIQFSLAQGALAAKNILNLISEKALLSYVPRDLGYIVPLANNKACGLVLGFKLKGFLAVFLHYFMCIFRSWNFRNKLGVVKNLIKGGV